MGLDFGMASDPIGQIRLGSAASILLSVCVIAFTNTADSSGDLNVNSVYFYSIVVCCSITCALVACGLFGLENDYIKTGDKVFHALAAMLISVIGIIYMKSAASGGNAKKITSGVFAIVYDACCIVLAYNLFQ